MEYAPERLGTGDSRGVAASDVAEMTALYAEFAEEDRALAEAGMADYAAGLYREDSPHPQPLPHKRERGAG